LNPITLENGLLTETEEIARRFAHRCNPAMIPCVSTWTDNQRPGVLSAESTPRAKAA
jgi:UDP-sulfoquinovose synthase